MKRLTFSQLAPAASALLAATLTLASALGAPAPAPKPPVVLHVGDSFVAAGFAQALRPRFQAVGAKYVMVSKKGAYIPSLLDDIKLPNLLAAYRPALVIITLGANEMNIENPEWRAAPVRKLVASIAPWPCVWTLPPRWSDKGAGFLQVIEREAKPCAVYDPTPIARDIKRGGDGIHPNAEGGAVWAEHFWLWLWTHAPSAAPG